MARRTDGIYAYMHVSRNQHHREPLQSIPTIWATRMPRGSSQTQTQHHRHKSGTVSHGLHQVNRLQHGAPLACSGGAHSHAPRHRISALGGRRIPVADQTWPGAFKPTLPAFQQTLHNFMAEGPNTRPFTLPTNLHKKRARHGVRHPTIG